MMRFRKAALWGGVFLLLLTAACDDFKPKSQTSSTTAAASAQGAPAAATVATAIPAPDVHPAPLQDIPPIEESASPLAQPIDTAEWTLAPETPEARKHALLRAEVLLARAHFSPGVNDGQDGGNLQNAISACEAAHDLPVDGKLDEEVWAALAADKRPVLTDYVIAADGV